MNAEEYDKRNYLYLVDYVKRVRGDYGEITKLVNSTLAQFLQGFRCEINHVANENDGTITGGDVVRTMLAQLRACIVDLEYILNNNKEVIQ